MRTFAFAQLLAATLAVNLNNSAYEGPGGPDLKDIKGLKEEDWLDLLAKLDKEDVEKLIKEADWDEVEKLYVELDDYAENFCDDFEVVCEEVGKKISELDSEDVDAWCEENE